MNQQKTQPVPSHEVIEKAVEALHSLPETCKRLKGEAVQLMLRVQPAPPFHAVHRQ